MYSVLKRFSSISFIVYLLVVSFIFIGFLPIPKTFAAEESITLTTYYPAPYGVYNGLAVNRLGVGDNNNSGTLTDADVPTNGGDVWIAGNVGIGTRNPAATLDIATESAIGIRARTKNDIPDGNTGYGPLIQLRKDRTPGWDQWASIALKNNDSSSNSRGQLDFILRDPPTNNNAKIVMTLESNGNVGIGTDSPGVKLEVAQNNAIKLGSAYMSSGGNYAHFANNLWYDGGAWQNNGTSGALIQLSGQNINFYRHNGAGVFTRSMTIRDTGNVEILGDVIGLTCTVTMDQNCYDSPWANIEGSGFINCNDGYYMKGIDRELNAWDDNNYRIKCCKFTVTCK